MGGGEETALKGAPHTPKYLETFTIGLIFLRQLKHEVATLCFDLTTHTPKYLDQLLTVLLATFTTGLIFVR